jgi:hypothetical protein
MYRFDTLDRTGVFLGLGVLQLALLGVAAIGGTVAVSTGLPLPVAVAPVVAAVAVALGRVKGERIIDWVPVCAGWILSARRGRRWHAPLHLLTGTEATRQPALPACLAGLVLIEAPSSWGRLSGACVIHDTSAHSMSALVRVQAHGFALASRDDQVRLLAGWGDVLAAFATERGAVARLSWSDFASATGMGDHLRWVAEREPPPSLANDAYQDLLGTFGSSAAGHDVVVTITVAADRLARGPRGTHPDERLLSALHKATESLTRALRSAALLAGDPLTTREVATLMRTRLDPCRERRRNAGVARRGGPLAERLGLIEPVNAGPLALETAWSCVRVDGAWHRAYWIAEWPRLQQHPDWMEPVLAFAGSGSRSVTVIFEPVAPSASRRRIDRESIKLETDAAAREQKGRRVDGGHRRLQQAVAEREAELVAGYAEVAYAGIITVTADEQAQLDVACDETEQVAREHGLDIRPLDGRHDVAFAGLPLGIGLARQWFT